MVFLWNVPTKLNFYPPNFCSFKFCPLPLNVWFGPERQSLDIFTHGIYCLPHWILESFWCIKLWKMCSWGLGHNMLNLSFYMLDSFSMNNKRRDNKKFFKKCEKTTECLALECNFNSMLHHSRKQKESTTGQVKWNEFQILCKLCIIVLALHIK